MSVIAIVVAAGRGERLGADRPKAFALLAGRPLVEWAVRAFENASDVDAIVVVVPDAEIDGARTLLKPLGKLQAVVGGGARRQDSVRAGLLASGATEDDIILVHDAARPFADASLIQRVISAVLRAGAALPVMRVTDTLKRVEGERVIETVDRQQLVSAQTPQGFRYGLLDRAYQALEANQTITDEAMALESLGYTVVAVDGSARNRKITLPEDLLWAEWQVAQTPVRS